MRIERACAHGRTPIRRHARGIAACIALLAAATWSGCGQGGASRPASENAPGASATESLSAALVDARASTDPAVTAFASESDPEKRIDLIEDVLSREMPADARLALLIHGADSDQPRAVRVAAIDVLSELEDPRVATILQLLKADPDQEVRELASEALAELEDRGEEGG
jgi:HEAT repeat protein